MIVEVETSEPDDNQILLWFTADHRVLMETMITTGMTPVAYTVHRTDW